jgi:purine-binding chemotaxis protein CheW
MAAQFCTFYLDGALYGLKVEQVQEIVRQQEMTPVPLANAVIAGLINLRGQIVSALDLRVRLGLNARKEGQLATNVLVRHDDESVSLLVDEIGDVVEVPEDAFEDAPDSVVGKARMMSRGVYKLPDKLLHVLDLLEVLFG